jgi:hypothetical protein
MFDTHLERLDIPILMTVKLLVNDSPAHRILDDVKVIWHIDARDGVLEEIMAIMALFWSQWDL